MTSVRICGFLLLFTFLAAGILSAGNPPVIQARIFIESKDAWVQLRDMHLDQVWAGENYIEIVTDQEELEKITSLGFKTEIVHSDLTKYFQSRLPAKAMGDYKTLDEINQYIDQVIVNYPEIVSQKMSIGLTIEGRETWAFKISDNPNVDEDEPELLYTAAIHAREVITPELLIYYIDHLTQNYGIDSDITDLVNEREMWFILVCNPDGYYHNEVIEPDGGGMWRKNRRDNGDDTYGVDLNRNFGYQWGYDDAGSSPYTSDPTYRGTAPFSEPESQNLRDFTISHDFVLIANYHSHSNLIIWPWGYDKLYCPDEDIFAQIGDTVQAMNNYDPGPGWTLYVVNGGTDDWYYGEQTLKDKQFSFTLEVGSYDDNFWPPASRINDLISENLEPNLFYARIAGDIYSLRAPAAPVLTVADTVSIISFSVDWTHYDTLNPASVYELIEMTDYQIISDSANGLDNWKNREFELSPARYSSFPTSFYSGEDNNIIRYVQSIDPYLVQSGDTLKVNTFYDIETDWDYAYVEVSTDGLIYMPIPGNITTTYDPNGNNRGNGITGFCGGVWTLGLFDLSGFVGQNVMFRFSYYTDSYVTEEGFYIDDIYPTGIFGSSVTHFPIMDTTYELTDRPEGDYYYKVRARDEERQWGQYSDIVQTYVTNTYVCGDANGDSNNDVADAVFLINYVFKGGPAPDPIEAGDANGDGETNIADGVYVINYVFKGGPEPVCP